MKNILLIGTGFVLGLLFCKGRTQSKREKLLAIVAANSAQYPGYEQIIIRASDQEIERLYDFISQYTTFDQLPETSTIYDDIRYLLIKYGIINVDDR